jgi:hypothetical protein
MDIETFQQELTLIGGRNLHDWPILKVVRGDQELMFACGRMIPKYHVPGGAKKEVEKKFHLRHIFTGEVKDCTFDEAKVVYERSQKYDLTNHWMAETCRIVRVTPTARDGYFIEQWIAPEKIKDTPETWEANRYKMWLDEEVGREVMTDILGPFPARGRYDNFLEVKALDSEALETIRRAWALRDRWKQTKSAELMVKDIFEEAEKRDALNEELVTDMLVSEMKPHAFRGTYMNAGDPQKMNKRTKHGRAK